MDRLLKNTIIINFALGLGYFLLAKLGFAWGALTSNATLLWPPSGLCLFAFLVFGTRALPGLMLGAITSIQWLSLSSALGNTPFSFLISTLMAASSVGQALLIAYWSRPWYLEEFRVKTHFAFYLVLFILLGCTIAPTFSNIFLWQANIIKFSDGLQNWPVWWLGDCIGMLTITPLLLWLYQRKLFKTNTQAHAVLIFCTGIGTVLFAVATIGHSENDAKKKTWAHQASNVKMLMQTHLDLANRDLDTLQHYYITTRLSQDDFKNLTELLLKRNSWIDSFSWIPLSIKQNGSAKKNGHTDNNNIIAQFSDGYKQTRTSDTEFLLSSPDGSDFSETTLKEINTINAPNINEFFWRATNTYTKKRDYKTPVIRFVAPVYACNKTFTATEESCDMRHIITSELNLNTWMRTVLDKAQHPTLQIRLKSSTQNKSGFSLEWKNNSWQASKSDNDAQYGHSLLDDSGMPPTLEVMNNKWQLMIVPALTLPWFVPGLFQLAVLIIGIALTLSLTAYLQAMHKHDLLIVENQKQLKIEIKNQTDALHSANDWLLKEIDDRRKTQEQLKQQESHLRTLVDNIPDPVWFKSNEGVYLSCNKAVEKMFNRSASDIVNRRPDDFIATQLAQDLRLQEELALASNQAVRKEFWIFIPQYNRHRLMDIIKIAVRDEQNNSLGILGISRDITDQYELIDELEKFKQFAEYASEGFGIITLTANTLYMNPSMNKMLNGSREQNNYKENFIDYYPPDIQQYFQEHVLPSVLLSGHWHGELAATHADGSRFPTKETFFIIRDDQGKPIYLGDVMSDISEQKKIESALQLAKEVAEEATQAKSRFLANMSHEIRTPLNAVLGYSQLLMSDQKLSQQQHERMKSILNAGQRLLHLINDVLDLSKIEAGALHLRNDYFDLTQELQDIIALMSTKASNKGLNLRCDIQLPSPAIVKSDRQKIGQIILNLLGNAIKFTLAGDVSFTVTMEANRVHFSIVDTGPGIAPNELQQLFSAFKQGKAGQDSGGTGLGLVISKNIAEHLGGSLVLESALGQGTQAHLRLPLTLEHNAEINLQNQTVDIKIAPDSSCRVLVVEDDEASRDVLVNLLQDIGCKVYTANNGEEGFNQALAQKPDIVFTDIRMPLLSGTEMLQKLRNHVSRSALPIIAVSASSLEHERTFYLGKGFHDFIGKPYQFSDIHNALSNFTSAKFISTGQTMQSHAEDSTDTVSWKERPDITELVTRLNLLKAALQAGEMATSKKLFASHSPQELGKITHQQLFKAIRQYDLVLAEKILGDLLNEINAAIPSAT